MYVGHWNLTTDILHNLRNAERILFLLYFLSYFFTTFKKSKNIMFNFKESSHDIVESSRYIQHDCSHMGTTEINWNSDAAMFPEKTDNTKKRTADAQVKHFWVYRFWASGRSITYVCGDTFILCRFVYI